MSGKILIENDVFDIAWRLKQIDPQYFVLYDKVKGRYEVHSHRQRKNTLAFIVPYGTLDKRTLDFARKTSMERKAKLIAEIDRDNERRENEISRLLIDKAQQKSRSLAKYIFAGREEIPGYEEL